LSSAGDDQDDNDNDDDVDVDVHTLQDEGIPKWTLPAEMGRMRGWTEGLYAV
jgi:hypothetical protein